MTHTPGHFNNDPGECPPCKIIIDGGFVRAAARLLASAAGESTTLGRNAIFLADMTESSSTAMLHGLEQGTVPPAAVDWDGCHRATEIMAWVEAVERRSDGGTLSEAEQAAIDAAPAKMRSWAIEEFVRVSALVAGTQSNK